MKIVLQKVLDANVAVNGQTVGSIGRGYLLLVGIVQGDTEAQAEWLAEKILALRLFSGDDGKINDKNLLEVQGEVLAVSQFTLAGDVSKGNRPDYTAAAERELARNLYDFFVRILNEKGVKKVQTGQFGAMMAVHLINDGPVTLILDR